MEPFRGIIRCPEIFCRKYLHCLWRLWYLIKVAAEVDERKIENNLKNKLQTKTQYGILVFRLSKESG